jgi:hypothetical protein
MHLDSTLGKLLIRENVQLSFIGYGPIVFQRSIACRNLTLVWSKKLIDKRLLDERLDLTEILVKHVKRLLCHYGKRNGRLAHGHWRCFARQPSGPSQRQEV